MIHHSQAPPAFTVSPLTRLSCFCPALAIDIPLPLPDPPPGSRFLATFASGLCLSVLQPLSISFVDQVHLEVDLYLELRYWTVDHPLRFSLCCRPKAFNQVPCLSKFPCCWPLNFQPEPLLYFPVPITQRLVGDHTHRVFRQANPWVTALAFQRSLIVCRHQHLQPPVLFAVSSSQVPVLPLRL